jgi:hypothetical protein
MNAMRQVLHLLVVDRDRRAALAGAPGSRWLLPVLVCAEELRAAPLVARWCDERSLPGDVAGQWLGRVAPDATDWLVPIVARSKYSAPDPVLQWTSLHALATGNAVLDYQQWAIAQAIHDDALPSVRGPFGNLAWPDAVRTWIGRAAGSAVRSMTPYRVSACEVVVGAETDGGRVYFKGLTRDRADEVRVTQTLAGLAPRSFARTLVLERRDDGTVWWLTAECPGRQSKDAEQAARALGQIQQAVITAGLTPPGLRAVDLDGAARWVAELSVDSACSDLVRRACAEAASADVPHTWIPMDIDPANILVDDKSAVRFIDLDDSFVGPAPLAMAVLANRRAARAACRAYEASWSPSLGGIDWANFEIAAKVVEMRLGWERLARNIEGGEVSASPDFVAERVRERLGRAIYRR